MGKDKDVCVVLVAVMDEEGNAEIGEFALNLNLRQGMDLMMVTIDTVGAAQIPLHLVQNVTESFIDVLEEHADRDEQELKKNGREYKFED